jgi:hypothetical protein
MPATLRQSGDTGSEVALRHPDAQQLVDLDIGLVANHASIAVLHHGIPALEGGLR